MQRFYLDSPLGPDSSELALPAHIARQIHTVLRMRPGDAVVLFDSSGREWPATLTRADRDGVSARLGEPSAPTREAPRRVTLCQALLKSDKMEWVLQKGTELGVARFEPLVTERVVAAKRAAPERWQRILVEATEQCGRTRLPELAEPAPLEQALSGSGAGVMCWEQERAQSLADWIATERPNELRLFIGPEGGFTEREAAAASRAGVQTASLGPRILRAETAAIAASALVLLAP